MADKLSYLDELLVTPRETGFGTMGNIIAQNLPGLVNPYASPGANFATVLGGGLLAGLLKYGAKQEAESQNAALMPKLLDVMGATSQQDLQTRLAQPGYEQLGGLGARLQLSMSEQQRKRDAEIAKQAAELQRQKDLELFKQTDPTILQAFAKREEIKKSTEAKYREPKDLKADANETLLPGSIGEKVALKMDTATSASNLMERIRAIPDLQFKGAQLTGISALSGDPGLVQALEQFATNYRASKFGMSLTGNELKSFNTAIGQNIKASKQDVLEAFEYLRNAVLNEARQTAIVASQPASKTLEQIEALRGQAGQQTTQLTEQEKTLAQQRIEFLRKQLGK